MNLRTIAQRMGLSSEMIAAFLGLVLFGTSFHGKVFDSIRLNFICLAPKLIFGPIPHERAQGDGGKKGRNLWQNQTQKGWPPALR